LFELVTGRVPFDGPVVRSVCIATVRAECPPPSSLRPEVPPELDAVVLKCLQKRPEQRFASAQELKAALEGLVGVESFEALDDDDVTDLNQAELDVPVTVCIELDDFDAERGVAETEPVPTELPRPRASRWRAPVLVALAAALVAAVFGVWPPARDAAHHVALAHAATLVTIQSAKEDVTTAMRHWKRMNLALPTLGGDAPQVELALEPPVQPEVGEPHAITPEPRAKRAALPPATVQGVRTHEPALWKPRYALHPEGPWQPRSPEHGERIGDADLIDPYPDR